MSLINPGEYWPLVENPLQLVTAIFEESSAAADAPVISRVEGAELSQWPLFEDELLDSAEQISLVDVRPSDNPSCVCRPVLSGDSDELFSIHLETAESLSLLCFPCL